jgi:hypothetical protein
MSQWQKEYGMAPQSQQPLDPNPVEVALEALAALTISPGVALPGDRAEIHALHSVGQTAPRDHLTLSEGVAAGKVLIREAGPGGQVPFLEIESQLDVKLLGLEGELLIGCKQNRLLNASVMLPAATTTRIPVSCVEAGRWSARSESMSPKSSLAPRRVRHATKQSVHHSQQQGLGLRSDQGAVWEGVDEESAAGQAFSASSNLDEILEGQRHRPGVKAIREALHRALDGAVGYVLVVDKRLEAVEALGHVEDFRRVSKGIADTLAVELASLPAVSDESRPASTDPTVDPLAFVQTLLREGGCVTPGLNLGSDLRARSNDGRWSCSALVEDGELRVFSALARLN